MKILLLVLALLLVSCNITPTAVEQSEWETVVSDANIVIVITWEDWCPYCKQALQDLNIMYADNSNVAVVGLNTGDSVAVIQERVETDELWNIKMLQSTKRSSSLPEINVYMRGYTSPFYRSFGWSTDLQLQLANAIDQVL